jgi:hypothetical protein
METIFISIASYRDSICSKTVESLYENADFPERIFLGICEQNNPETEENESCSKNTFKYHSNIKKIKIPNWAAKGPTWARYLCSTLFDNQDYFCQIDSHSIFAKSWDTKCITQIKEIQKLGNPNIILSYYPKSFDQHAVQQETPQIQNTVPRICQSFFNDRGMISFLGAEDMAVKKDENIQTPYVTGGFLFTTKSFLIDVPFDPELPYLFVGEEILHSARAFTANYNVYVPSQDIVFHYYTRKDEPKIWTDNKTYKDTDAFNKAKLILGLSPEEAIPKNLLENIQRYSLGTKRTLQEFYDFAGISLDGKVVVKNFCHPEQNGILPKKPTWHLHFFHNLHFIAFIAVLDIFLVFILLLIKFNI